MNDEKRSVRGVVIVSPGGIKGAGGMGSVTRAMYGWLVANRPDIRVDVIDSRGHGAAHWSFFYVVGALFKLLWLRVRYRPEVLHLQVSENLSFPRKGITLMLGRMLGMRTVLHHHGAELIPFFQQASPQGKALVRKIARSADINIVLGEIWRKFLIDEVDIDPHRIVVRLNAADDLAIAGPRVAHDPWHFLISANLSPRKGAGELLEAVRKLKDAGMPIRLTLAGGGQPEYIRQAKQLGIGDICDFKGWCVGAKLHQLFLSHSALVLPSHNEGLPMTIIEALSARLPVVTTPVGSIPEVLDDGVNCLFVEPGNVGEIAAALHRIASEPALRAMLSENGRRLYDDQFEIDGYMKRMLALYADLPPRS